MSKNKGPILKDEDSPDCPICGVWESENWVCLGCYLKAQKKHREI